MATTALAVERIAVRCGFPKPRVRAVARALTESGRLPPGGPGKAPSIDVWHVVDIVLGSSVDAPLRAISATVAAYRELGLPGHDASGMPASVAEKYHCAGDFLDLLADMSAHGTLDAQADVAKLKLEIVASWPEISLHHVDRSVHRFCEAGSLPAHWQSSGHRKSTIINGDAFVDVIRDLFAGGK